jgi:hypothetical protein
LSKYHQGHPFVFWDDAVGYEPGEAAAMLKGGNSNWRGPVWFPTTFMLIESLRKLRKAYGDGFTIGSITDGEGPVTPDDMARGFSAEL